MVPPVLFPNSWEREAGWVSLEPPSGVTLVSSATATGQGPAGETPVEAVRWGEAVGETPQRGLCTIWVLTARGMEKGGPGTGTDIPQGDSLAARAGRAGGDNLG